MINSKLPNKYTKMKLTRIILLILTKPFIWFAGVFNRVIIRSIISWFVESRKTLKAVVKFWSVIGMTPEEIYENGFEFSGTEHIRNATFYLNVKAYLLTALLVYLAWVTIVMNL